MKKIMIIVAGAMFLVSCSNNGGESGAVNDGYNGISDTNSGLPNDKPLAPSPSIDSAKGDHRVDTEKRDSNYQQPGGTQQ